MEFSELADFIDRRMRMSHVYQPVVLAALLGNGGRMSETELARGLLQEDLSQVEYYEQIVRNMVGKVLRSHKIVERDSATKEYSLSGFESLSNTEIESLILLCDRKLQEFLEKRGDQPWQHRRKSTGYISGTLRYEVLKAAKFHCELCGIAADKKALEVDHILPRNHDGGDEISNLQALCYSCNAMKRDRDDTDFREVRKSFDRTEGECPFCNIPEEKILAKNSLAIAFYDGFPVTEGHTLVVPLRHEASVFELGTAEHRACLDLMRKAREALIEKDSLVTGFNVGVNDGVSAGQTVFHCHWHLIPRRESDVENPRGGVRNTIPGKGDY